MATIVPVTEMRDTNKFTEKCKKSNEPIFVTKNGYGDIVCMSIELYESMLEKIEVQKKINDAMLQMKNNEVIDGKDFLKELKEKYGKQL